MFRSGRGTLDFVSLFFSLQWHELACWDVAAFGVELLRVPHPVHATVPTFLLVIIRPTMCVQSASEIWVQLCVMINHGRLISAERCGRVVSCIVTVSEVHPRNYRGVRVVVVVYQNYIWYESHHQLTRWALHGELPFGLELYKMNFVG